MHAAKLSKNISLGRPEVQPPCSRAPMPAVGAIRMPDPGWSCTHGLSSPRCKIIVCKRCCARWPEGSICPLTAPRLLSLLEFDNGVIAGGETLRLRGLPSLCRCFHWLPTRLTLSIRIPAWDGLQLEPLDAQGNVTRSARIALTYEPPMPRTA